MAPVSGRPPRQTKLVLSAEIGGCPGVPVHEGIPIVLITIHGVMTQFVNVSFFCVPVHEDTTGNWQRMTFSSPEYR